MPRFEWQRWPTRQLGDRWVSIAQVPIESASGRVRVFAMQVDSGAMVSLLSHSAGLLLGVQINRGTRVTLTGLGGRKTVGFLHDLPVCFEDSGRIAVPFAIAETDLVPNLLGWQGVFDRFRLTFDPIVRATFIESAGLRNE